MNWEGLVNNIIGNAVNGIISGIFTVIGVLLTINYEKRKDAKREKKQRYKNKAELIVEEGKFESDKECNIRLIVAIFRYDKNGEFIYSNKYKNTEEYIFKDFVFKNVGKTAIEELEVVTTCKQAVSIFDIEFAQTFMESGVINYHYMWDKKIFPNQELKIRLYFHKDMVINSAYSSAFIIQYVDSNGMCWEQPFFESDYKLYSPIEISYKEYRNNASVQQAMECFEKPWLW